MTSEPSSKKGRAVILATIMVVSMVAISATALGGAAAQADDEITITETHDAVEGDFIEIDLELHGDATDGWVDISTDDYQLEATIDAGNADEVTLRFNTYTAGHAVEDELLLTAVEDDVSVTVENQDPDDREFIMEGELDFDVAVAAGDADSADDEGTVTLLERPSTAGDLDTWQASADVYDGIDNAEDIDNAIADGDLTEVEEEGTLTVDEDELLIHEINAESFEGMFEATAEDNFRDQFWTLTKATGGIAFNYEEDDWGDAFMALSDLDRDNQAVEFFENFEDDTVYLAVDHTDQDALELRDPLPTDEPVVAHFGLGDPHLIGASTLMDESGEDDADAWANSFDPTATGTDRFPEDVGPAWGAGEAQLRTLDVDVVLDDQITITDTHDAVEGDFIEIDLELHGDATEGWVDISTDDYQLEATIDAGNADEVTLRFNTYTAGQAVEDELLLTAAEEDVSVTVEAQDPDDREFIMEGELDFDVAVAAGDADSADDEGTVTLLERPSTAGDLDTWRVSTDVYDEIESVNDIGDAIADGEVIEVEHEDTVFLDHEELLIHEVNAESFEGMFEATAEDNFRDQFWTLTKATGGIAFNYEEDDWGDEFMALSDLDRDNQAVEFFENFEDDTIYIVVDHTDQDALELRDPLPTDEPVVAHFGLGDPHLIGASTLMDESGEDDADAWANSFDPTATGTDRFPEDVGPAWGAGEAQLRTVNVAEEALELSVTVEDQHGDAIDDASVTVDGQRATTDAEGVASFTLEDGEYDVSASADLFLDSSTTVDLEGEDSSVTLTLQPDEEQLLDEGEIIIDDARDAVQGDFIEIDLSLLDGTTDGVIEISNDDYQLEATFDAGDTDEVTLRFNTYTAGQAVEDELLLTAVEDDVSVTVENQDPDDREFIMEGELDFDVAVAAQRGDPDDTWTATILNRPDTSAVGAMPTWQIASDIYEGIDNADDMSAAIDDGELTEVEESGIVVADQDQLVVHELNIESFEGMFVATGEDEFRNQFFTLMEATGGIGFSYEEDDWGDEFIDFVDLDPGSEAIEFLVDFDEDVLYIVVDVRDQEQFEFRQGDSLPTDEPVHAHFSLSDAHLLGPTQLSAGGDDPEIWANAFDPHATGPDRFTENAGPAWPEAEGQTRLFNVVDEAFELTVNVEDEAGNTIEDANVRVDGIEVTSDADGVAKFILMDGEYDVSVSAEGFLDASDTVEMDGDDASVTLTLEAVFELEVTAEDEAGNAIEGATVTVDDELVFITDDSGVATFTLEKGDYEISASAGGFLDTSTDVSIEDESVSITLTLEAEDEDDDDDDRAADDDDVDDTDDTDDVDDADDVDDPVDEDDDDDDTIPGFGFVVALFGLLGMALLAHRRQS